MGSSNPFGGFSIYNHHNTDNWGVALNKSGTWTSLDTGVDIEVNKWVHLVYTYDGSKMKFFVNGDQEFSSTQSGSLQYAGSINFEIGRNVSSYAPIKVGQVRAYSSALSQAQIRQNYNFTKPNYPNGFNGTISGATWNASGYFDFDGSNDFVDLGDIKGTGNELTVSAWINPDSTQSNAYATVFDFEHSNDEGWVLYQDNTNTNNYKVALKEGSSYDITSSTSLTANTWHHIAITVDSNNDFELYVNNTNTQSLSNWGGLGAVERRLNLGCWGSSNGTTRSRFWNGQMTKIKVYDKALTQAEITALYNEEEDRLTENLRFDEFWAGYDNNKSNRAVFKSGGKIVDFNTESEGHAVLNQNAQTSGKYYVEIELIDTSGHDGIGVFNRSSNTVYDDSPYVSKNPADANYGAYLYSRGSLVRVGSTSQSGYTDLNLTNGDIVCMAVDVGSKKIWWGRRDGLSDTSITWNDGNPSTDTGGLSVTFVPSDVIVFHSSESTTRYSEFSCVDDIDMLTPPTGFSKLQKGFDTTLTENEANF